MGLGSGFKLLALTLFPRRREEAAAAQKAAERAGAEASRLEGGLREVRGKLEQRRSDTTAQRSQSAVIQALMAAKAKGEIPGIYGRLGEAPLLPKTWPPLPARIQMVYFLKLLACFIQPCWKRELAGCLGKGFEGI